MTDAIQYFAVILIVTGAIVFLGRRAWKLLYGRDGNRCGGCSSCSLKTVPMVPLESLRNKLEEISS
ncbi:MAG: hypothetical protein ACYC0X_20660 [Pirellulaceae bacterium]